MLGVLPAAALALVVSLGGRTAAPTRAVVVANEADLIDVAKSVFDEEECLVDAENAAESAACREAPSEPFIYAGAPPAPEIKGPPPLPKRGTHGLEECIVEAEGYAEIADCKETYSSAPGTEDGVAPRAEEGKPLWRPITNAVRSLLGREKK